MAETLRKSFATVPGRPGYEGQTSGKDSVGQSEDDAIKQLEDAIFNAKWQAINAIHSSFNTLLTDANLRNAIETAKIGDIAEFSNESSGTVRYLKDDPLINMPPNGTIDPAKREEFLRNFDSSFGEYGDFLTALEYYDMPEKDTDGRLREWFNKNKELLSIVYSDLIEHDDISIISADPKRVRNVTEAMETTLKTLKERFIEQPKVAPITRASSVSNVQKSNVVGKNSAQLKKDELNAIKQLEDATFNAKWQAMNILRNNLNRLDDFGLLTTIRDTGINKITMLEQSDRRRESMPALLAGYQLHAATQDDKAKETERKLFLDSFDQNLQLYESFFKEVQAEMPKILQRHPLDFEIRAELNVLLNRSARAVEFIGDNLREEEDRVDVLLNEVMGERIYGKKPPEAMSLAEVRESTVKMQQVEKSLGTKYRFDKITPLKGEPGRANSGVSSGVDRSKTAEPVANQQNPETPETPETGNQAQVKQTAEPVANQQNPETPETGNQAQVKQTAEPVANQQNPETPETGNQAQVKQTELNAIKQLEDATFNAKWQAMNILRNNLNRLDDFGLLTTIRDTGINKITMLEQSDRRRESMPALLAGYQLHAATQDDKAKETERKLFLDSFDQNLQLYESFFKEVQAEMPKILQRHPLDFEIRAELNVLLNRSARAVEFIGDNLREEEDRVDILLNEVMGERIYGKKPPEAMSLAEVRESTVKMQQVEKSLGTKYRFDKITPLKGEPGRANSGVSSGVDRSKTAEPVANQQNPETPETPETGNQAQVKQTAEPVANQQNPETPETGNQAQVKQENVDDAGITQKYNDVINEVYIKVEAVLEKVGEYPEGIKMSEKWYNDNLEPFEDPLSLEAAVDFIENLRKLDPSLVESIKADIKAIEDDISKAVKNDQINNEAVKDDLITEIENSIKSLSIAGLEEAKNAWLEQTSEPDIRNDRKMYLAGQFIKAVEGLNDPNLGPYVQNMKEAIADARLIRTGPEWEEGERLGIVIKRFDPNLEKKKSKEAIGPENELEDGEKVGTVDPTVVKAYFSRDGDIARARAASWDAANRAKMKLSVGLFTEQQAAVANPVVLDPEKLRSEAGQDNVTVEGAGRPATAPASVSVPQSERQGSANIRPEVQVLEGQDVPPLRPTIAPEADVYSSQPGQATTEPVDSVEITEDISEGPELEDQPGPVFEELDVKIQEVAKICDDLRGNIASVMEMYVELDGNITDAQQQSIDGMRESRELIDLSLLDRLGNHEPTVKAGILEYMTYHNELQAWRDGSIINGTLPADNDIAVARQAVDEVTSQLRQLQATELQQGSRMEFDGAGDDNTLSASFAPRAEMQMSNEKIREKEIRELLDTFVVKKLKVLSRGVEIPPIIAEVLESQNPSEYLRANHAEITSILTDDYKKDNEVTNKFFDNIIKALDLGSHLDLVEGAKFLEDRAQERVLTWSPDRRFNRTVVTPPVVDSPGMRPGAEPAFAPVSPEQRTTVADPTRPSVAVTQDPRNAEVADAGRSSVTPVSPDPRDAMVAPVAAREAVFMPGPQQVRPIVPDDIASPPYNPAQPTGGASDEDKDHKITSMLLSDILKDELSKGIDRQQAIEPLVKIAVNNASNFIGLSPSDKITYSYDGKDKQISVGELITPHQNGRFEFDNMPVAEINAIRNAGEALNDKKRNGNILRKILSSEGYFGKFALGSSAFGIAVSISMIALGVGTLAALPYVASAVGTTIAVRFVAKGIKKLYCEAFSPDYKKAVRFDQGASQRKSMTRSTMQDMSVLLQGDTKAVNTLKELARNGVKDPALIREALKGTVVGSYALPDSAINKMTEELKVLHVPPGAYQAKNSPVMGAAEATTRTAGDRMAAPVQAVMQTDSTGQAKIGPMVGATVVPPVVAPKETGVVQANSGVAETSPAAGDMSRVMRLMSESDFKKTAQVLRGGSATVGPGRDNSASSKTTVFGNISSASAAMPGGSWRTGAGSDNARRGTGPGM